MYVNCRTFYSFQYGTFTTRELVEKAVENGVTALALTNINSTCDAWEAVIDSTEKLMTMLSGEIKSIEKNIHDLIETNKDLQHTYGLVTSVVGIGFATAVHFIIATENFARFENVRKLICYCGVAPFKHESGTSIRGRTRVNPLANKKLKTLLTMAAICAVRFDPGLKSKYHQKVGEGKPKMSVLNIIRAKLIERIFTVVKRGSPYEIRLAA